MMKAQLVVVQGKPEGKAIPLVGPVFKIGRSEKCHLRPGSEEISREHVELTLDETTVTARDLGSRNGTLLNGKPMPSTPTALRNGDLIQLGKLTFAVSIQGGAVSTAPPRPVSLDDVSQDKIDQWLVADEGKPMPDRPSGIYGGDTLTLNAYKEGGSGTHKTMPAPAVASAPASATPAAKPAAPAPQPAPPPVAPAPVAAPVVTAPPPAASPPAAPVAAPIAATAKPAPVAAPQPELVSAGLGGPSFLHEFLDNAIIEALPEGGGDEAIEAAIAEADPEGDAKAPASQVEEELMDESNPFYAAKKAQAAAAQSPQAASSKKDPYKDSSDAAHDILRKMTDRRRS
jgi:predicted component of type VI protein secretion system